MVVFLGPPSVAGHERTPLPLLLRMDSGPKPSFVALGGVLPSTTSFPLLPPKLHGKVRPMHHGSPVNAVSHRGLHP